MMKHRVKPHEVKGLLILIGIVDSLNSRKEVKTIQEELLKILKDPKQYRCWSKDEIDSLFIGTSGGDWSDEKDGHAYGAIKPTFKIIKDLMFKEDSECTEFGSGSEW